MKQHFNDSYFSAITKPEEFKQPPSNEDVDPYETKKFEESKIFRPEEMDAVPNKGDLKEFNDVLEAIGGFGRQQKILFAAQCLLSYYYGFVVFGHIFLVLTPPDHWCAIPQEQKELLLHRMNLQNTFNDTLSSVAEKLSSPYQSTSFNELDDDTLRIKHLIIPKTESGTDRYDNCHTYDVNWTHVAYSKDVLTPDDNWPIKKCSDGWEYDFSVYYPTITSELSWVCDDAPKMAFSQAVFYIGSVVGGPLFGWLAGHSGRRSAIIASNLLSGLAGVAAALSPNFPTFCASLFVLGFNAYSQINIVYILTMEFVTTKYRSLVANIPFTVFLTLSLTSLPWIAYFTANWRLLGIVLYTPLFASPLLWWFMPESVRWQVSKGRKTCAFDTLKRVARANGVQVTDKLESSLQRYVSGQRRSDTVSSIEILKTPRLRKHFLALSVLLISGRILYDGHVRVSKSINYNRFITFSISSSTEVISGLTSFVLADKFGRKHTNFVTLFVATIVEMAMAFTPAANVYMMLVLHSVAKMLFALNLNLSFMMAVEVLPTVTRSQATGVIHTMGFLMAFVTPYIAYIADSCTYCARLVLVAVAFIGCLDCLFFLPETRNEDLPDTLEEGEAFGRGQSILFCPRGKEEKRGDDC